MELKMKPNSIKLYSYTCTVTHIPSVYWLHSCRAWCHKHQYKHNKTLGRAQDPRANGAWLSKLMNET